MIYDQEGGTCTGFAYAQLVGKVTGKFPDEKEIYDFYKRWDTDRIEGMTVNDLLEACRYDPIGPYTPRSVRRIFTTFSKSVTKKKRALHELRMGSKFRNTGFIAGLKIISKLRVKNGYLVPQTGKMKGFHAVYVEYDKEENDLIIYNSWGEDWGEKGKARLRMDDLGWDQLHSIYRVELNLPHGKQ